jgi:hypothetical protein
MLMLLLHSAGHLNWAFVILVQNAPFLLNYTFIGKIRTRRHRIALCLCSQALHQLTHMDDGPPLTSVIVPCQVPAILMPMNDAILRFHALHQIHVPQSVRLHLSLSSFSFCILFPGSAHANGSDSSLLPKIPWR